MAAGEGRLQLVKLLLHHGADPAAAVDNRGNTGAGEVSGQPLIVPMTMKHSDFFSNDVMARPKFSSVRERTLQPLNTSTSQQVNSSDGLVVEKPRLEADSWSFDEDEPDKHDMPYNDERAEEMESSANSPDHKLPSRDEASPNKGTVMQVYWGKSLYPSIIVSV